mgnify:CR=1 FL=1
MPMNQSIEVLIVANSVPLREGLHSLALSLSMVTTVYAIACDIEQLTALQGVDPALLLLDCDRPGAECQAFLAQARATWPHLQMIVLVDSVATQSYLSSPLATPPTMQILLRGTHVAKLTAMLHDLLTMPG